ncbi:MAG: holo-ACP synthase [Pseudomonadota bacterium]
MIHGIGTDIVAIARMTRLWRKYGEALAARLLADDELHALRQHHDPARFLAKRFAAKEAAAKALGTGFRDGLSLRHIAVRNNALGKPELEFTARARELLADYAIQASHVSISDESDYAVAFVVLTR